jgi:hypothetical protein
MAEWGVSHDMTADDPSHCCQLSSIRLNLAAESIAVTFQQSELHQRRNVGMNPGVVPA